jgi:exodeoxyribonuclease VII small subunit
MAAQPSAPPKIDKMNFEDALAELEAIVRRLESGDSKLDDAISAYERGALLRAHCEAKLREAQAKVEKISRTADGSLGTEDAEIE